VSPEANCDGLSEDDFDEFGSVGMYHYFPLEILISLMGVVTFIDELSFVIDDDLLFALLA
jgi:hypothetical protein